MIEVTQGYNNEFPLTETENKFVYFYSKKSYIVVLNGKPIGFFNMSELKGIGKVNLEYCLLKGYRGQKIGDAFYKLVLEYVSKSFPHYSGITLLVDYRNEISKKIVIQNGASIDYDLYDQFMENGEGNDHIPYETPNHFYVSPKKQR